MLFHVLFIAVRLVYSVWASPLQEASSTSAHGGNDLRKREHVLECDALEINMRTLDGTALVVGTLPNLCLDYPQGLGASCDGPEIIMRLPLNPMYFNIHINGGGGIATLCRRFCRCINVAPDPPAIHEATVNRGEAECALDEVNDIIPSSVQSQTSQASATTECSPNNHDNDEPEPAERLMTYASRYQCDGSFYGHPNSADCKAAIQLLPDWGIDGNIYREFYENGSPSENSNSIHVHYGQILDGRTSFTFGDSVKAPLMLTHDTCTVAILIPSDPQESVVVRSKELIRVTETLESKCVSRSGSGGKFDHVWDSSSASDRWIPDVFIFGKKSLMESWLDLILKSRRLNNENLKKGSEKISDTGPVPKGSQQACSGSCLNPNDCDINSDCVCASDKPVPLSSTWGQHACMHVAGAALAIAQNTAIKPHTRCRGRCLPEDDSADATGLLALANRTKTTMISFNTSFARLSRPRSGEISSHSAAIISGVIPSTFRNINVTQTSDSSTRLPSNISALSTGPQNQSFFTDLTCPCNCTYVSAACCLSHTVWEDPTLQIQMTPLPVNVTVYCDDANSGKWLPKSPNPVSTPMYTAVVPTASDHGPVSFVGIGSVKFNVSASSKGFQDEETIDGDGDGGGDGGSG